MTKPVTLYRVIEEDDGFRPEVLVETPFSALLRTIFVNKAPVFKWYGIGGFGYTTCVKDMVKLTSYERAVGLIENFTGGNVVNIKGDKTN